MSKITVVLCLTSFLACWQIGVVSYPMSRGEKMLDGYSMGLAKKDPSLKDSLLSALILSEMPRGTPSQRKKAVDSTFIRFGRSSMSDSHDTIPEASPSSTDFDYFSKNSDKHANDEDSSSPDNVSVEYKNKGQNHGQIQPPLYYDPPIPNDCFLKTKSDLFRALMGKVCIKRKVKRENVNDTFIRFGKRAAPDQPPEISNSEHDSANQIRYGRSEKPKKKKKT